MRKEIYLAGGCFWGTEKYFAQISGVLETEVGYANGNTENPTYHSVCKENTGHAETVKVVYDDRVLSLDRLLEMYYAVINPTAVNRQGGDIGVQYRTGIYYGDEKDQPMIAASLMQLQTKYSEPLAVEALPLANYTAAEAYHQKYLDKNPQGYCHIGATAFEKAKQATPFSKKPQEALKSILTPLQYEVTQNSATERAFAGEYHDHFAPGIYVDVTTGEPLFVSTDKFESGCGWPAFSKPIEQANLHEIQDTTHGMVRVEVRSRVGAAHLGHVFTDGPKDLGGLRYCINSAALRFVEKAAMEQEGYGAYLEWVK